MNRTATNLAQKFTQFSEHWSPKIVAQMYATIFSWSDSETNLSGTVIQVAPAGTVITGDASGDLNADGNAGI